MRSVKQRDTSDCGVACLAAIASHYQMRLSVAQVRQMTGTDASGTTVFGLVQASKYLGFVARAVKAQPTELAKASVPAIAHVVVNETLLHYVVLVKLGKERVTVMDPATGRFSKLSLATFQKMWSGVLILMAPSVTFAPGDQRRSRLSWYAQLLKPHVPILLQALIGAILSTLLALAGSFYIQKVVDSVIVESNTQLLNLLSLGMLIALAFNIMLGIGQNLLLTKSGQIIDLTLILSYYRHLFTLPQSFFDSMRVGEMVSRINDAVKIRAFLNQQGANFVVSALTLVLAVAAMFVFSWKLALISVGFLLVYSVLFKIAIWRNRLFSRRIMEQSADFDAQIVESLEMASTFRRFERQWVAEIKTESLLVKLLESTYSSGLFAIGVNSFGGIIVQSFTIVLMWVGACAVIRTQMSPGQLISCFALTGYLTGPANSLLAIIVSALDTQVAADRLFEILDLESEVDSGSINLREIERLDISLDNVTFAYPGRLPILNNVSARFRPSEITLLRGESGCGKSSLLTLLQRFHAPSEGHISFGQYDIQYLNATSLRTQIAVVPQKIDLMSGTVTENITFCDAEPKMQRILTICRKLGMLDFIQTLPQGFDTKLAENGRNLSGGQRQRIAIARALYVENALIYLFDEPTAALDEVSERYLLEALRELRDAGKIVILVSHDSRLIDFADRVYEVKKEVIELVAKASPAPPSREIKLLPAPPSLIPTSQEISKSAPSPRLEIEYVQKSLAKQKRRRWSGNTVRWTAVGSLVVLAAGSAQWWVTDLGRKKADADPALSQFGVLEPQLKRAEGRVQFAEKRADLATSQLSALETQLKKALEKAETAKKTADLAISQRSTLEGEVKKAQDTAQTAQKNADLAASQRSTLENDLKKALEKAQTARQTADEAISQRSALEADLTKAQEAVKEAQKSGDLAASQRAALEGDLKKALEKAQAAQQTADEAISQRSALEAELRKAEEKMHTAQKTADLATGQGSALEAEVKKAQDTAQAAQKNADLAASQRSTLENDLKKALEKAQTARQTADEAISRSSALEADLTKAQEAVKEAQKSGDLAPSQRSALEAELRKAQDTAQTAQKNADLAASQRSTLESDLKKALEKAQTARQTADEAASQRSALEAELKKTQDAAQTAQRNADLAASQHSTLENDLKKALEKAQIAQQTADEAINRSSALEADLTKAQEAVKEAQKSGDLAATQGSALEAQLKQVQDKLQQAQQRADLATTERNAMEVQLKKAQQAQLAQQGADLIVAQARPEEDRPSKAQSAKKNAESENQFRSGRALPLDAEPNPQGISSQPVIPSVKSANQ